MSENDILIADIGGTNARLALAATDQKGLGRVRSYACIDFPSVDDLIAHYLHSNDVATPRVMCLAAAGPVVGNTIQLTNSPWSIDAGDVSATFDGARVLLLNDFDAVAYSLPLLESSDCMQVGGPAPAQLGNRDYTIAAVGPGTGLGTAALRNVGQTRISVGGEAGLSGFAPVTAEQMEIVTVLRQRIERITSEHLVSGRGLQNLYWALSRMNGSERPELGAEEIGEACIAGSDPIATSAMRVFFEVLGQYAGDVALIFGAIDGIYIAGGIAGRYREMLLNSAFRTTFEAKPPHDKLMKSIPTQLITHSQPGLLGAADYARRNANTG
ncbi:MAG: glucokinase [Gammaproteobacteria bacterium]|nr:glucokinase [Gammaproteobacteria bacterium]